jgi:hypothetical protein
VKGLLQIFPEIGLEETKFSNMPGKISNLNAFQKTILHRSFKQFNLFITQ